MWEFYLAAFEASFRFDDLVVFQFQLTSDLARRRGRGNISPSIKIFQVLERMMSFYFIVSK